MSKSFEIELFLKHKQKTPYVQPGFHFHIRIELLKLYKITREEIV